MPVNLPSGSRAYWNYHWKDAPLKNETGNWSLWNFALHYASSVTRYDPTHFLRFIRPGLPESFLNILIAMLEAGADAHSTITVASKAENANWIRNREVSAFAVLHQLMLSVWDTRASLKKSSRNAITPTAAMRFDADSLAEKACRIEDIMTSKKARMWSRDLPSELSHNPRDTKNWEGAGPGVPKEPEAPNVGSTAKLDKSKRTRRAIAKPKVGKPDQSPSTDPKFQNVGPSPWTQHKLHAQSGSPTEIGIARNAQELYKQKQWEFTPRARRVALLEPEEQEL